MGSQAQRAQSGKGLRLWQATRRLRLLQRPRDERVAAVSHASLANRQHREALRHWSGSVLSSRVTCQPRPDSNAHQFTQTASQKRRMRNSEYAPECGERVVAVRVYICIEIWSRDN